MNAHLAVSLPLMLMSASALAVMLAIAVKRNHLAAAAITVLGLGASFLSLLIAASAIPQQLGRLLIIDSYSLLYMALLLCAAAFVILLSYNYLEQRHEHREEFYILILLATAGAMVLVASRHFISLFLGLELLSVSLYALISYIRSATISIEAGIKYLVLAASSSSLLLFGLALIYEESGSMDLAQLAAALNHAATFPFIAGLMLVFTGVGFKLAVVPFHLWTPDVYEGAPLPVTAFIATVSKGGMFALILRWLHLQNTGLAGTVGVVLSIIAIASMLTGNLLALTQTNVKRILAYSSIAHMGYALVALIAGGTLGAPAATYYLAAYFTTILGAFGVMTILSGPEGEAASIDDYRGLFWRRPILAAAFTAMLLSLAGIPLTAGFLGKFYVIAAGASQSRWVLLFTLIVSSTIGLFYYLRILAAMYAKTSDTSPSRTTLPVPATIALAVLTGLIFLLGLYPAPLWSAIVSAARTLG